MGQQKQPLFRFHVFVHVYAEVLLDLFVLKVVFFFFVFFYYMCYLGLLV